MAAHTHGRHTNAKNTYIRICTPISRRMNSAKMKKIKREELLKNVVSREKKASRAMFCNLFHM